MLKLDKEKPYRSEDIAWQVVIHRQEHKGFECVFNHHGDEINDPRKDYTGVILPNKGGKKFTTPATAQTAMEAKGLEKTHEVIRFNGGYAICPKQK